MKQLFSEKDIVGRVISQTHLSDGNFWISFTDKSFIVLCVFNKSIDFGYDDHIVSIVDYQLDYTHKELVILGLISEFEHKNAILKQEEEYDREEKEYREQERLRVEKIEREQYEQLAKKYGQR